MKGLIAYIRVSTVKQGKGVSLQEQRDAISHYAEKHGLTIIMWLEEMETAAKRGRKKFNEMLTLLRAGKAQGVIVHKLDRGVRNLKDWADIGELIDQGIEVHFANDGLDLTSRGGRLAADIQAVVAADYIRNLKEETRKGLNGRLKQGIYPLPAPIGYTDEGKAKPKKIDPDQGPLIRSTFELYDSGNFSFDTLGDEMYRRGLRNKRGGRVTKTGLSIILNNPFYIGIIRLKSRNEHHPGIHEPLISHALFKRVSTRLKGKTNRTDSKNAFQFRRLIRCHECKYSLIGERQKGHVYYRCHTRACTGASFREEAVEKEVRALLSDVTFDEEDAQELARLGRELWDGRRDEGQAQKREATLGLGKVKERLNRLTDAFLDGALERSLFEDRKAVLLIEQKRLEEVISNPAMATSSQSFEKFLELAKTALLSYERGDCVEKRKMLELVTSNREASGKSLYFEPANGFREIVNHSQTTYCAPQQDRGRTLKALFDALVNLHDQGLLLADTDSVAQ